MTTLGSQYIPQTAEARILTLVLAFYAVAVFGYFTAALASYLIGQDEDKPASEATGLQEVAALREEIAALRRELRNTNRSEI